MDYNKEPDIHQHFRNRNHHHGNQFDIGRYKSRSNLYKGDRRSLIEQKFLYSKVIKGDLACTMSKFGANVKGFVTFINISACNAITTKSISTFAFITSFCIFTPSMSRATWSTKFTLVDIWASIPFKSIITFALKASDTVYALWYVYRAYWSERWFWAFVNIYALSNVVILAWVQTLFLSIVNFGISTIP